MITLPRFQALAMTHWSEHGLGRSAEHCEHRLRLDCSFLTACRCAEDIQPRHARLVLSGLKDHGLGPASVRAYYATLKSAHRIAGLAPIQWPRAPKSPRRRSREAMSQGDYSRLIDYLEECGWQNTADLARLLNGAGLRVGVEAYRETGISVTGSGSLHITGKGSHQRTIRVAEPGAREVLGSQARLSAIREVGLDAHRWRWRKAVAALGIGSALPSPHSLRHKYATELAAVGTPLLMVKDMLGHANLVTTAGYIMPDYAGMDEWLARREAANSPEARKREAINVRS